jgi:hypothetical protein
MLKVFEHFRGAAKFQVRRLCLANRGSFADNNVIMTGGYTTKNLTGTMTVNRTLIFNDSIVYGGGFLANSDLWSTQNTNSHIYWDLGHDFNNEFERIKFYWQCDDS